MSRELEKSQLIERSIIKRFRKEIWNPFIEGVKRYQLIQAGDRIAVCMSGGKDSMLLAKLKQQLQKHSDVPFELEFLVMDPGYAEMNRQKIIDNAALMQIPIKIFDSKIYDVVSDIEQNPAIFVPE
jgi:tRNA(Ile)-lysidine synthase TilS/MesJ